MDWLNYHHLYYFWTVVRHNSVTKASQELHLSQPTISTQVRQLEAELKTKLLRRQGRGMVLTEVGRSVYRYADEIFSLGRELQDAVAGHESQRPLRVAIGLADVVPKVVAQKLLQPLLTRADSPRIVCQEGRPERLLTELCLKELDLVVTDTPTVPAERNAVFTHALDECGVSVYGTPKLRRAYGRKFPRSLQDAPMLLPAPDTMLRRALDQWFFSIKVRPRIVGEFDDSALIKTFGQVGVGLFAAPSGVEQEVCSQFGVRVVGRIETIRERFYIMALEARVHHPAIEAVLASARRGIWR